MKFDGEELMLLELLKYSLADDKEELPAASGGKPVNWDRLLVIARRHNVLSLLYPVCENKNFILPEPIQSEVQKAAVSAAKQSYRLLFLSKYLVYRLKENHIPVVLLKGVATASFYPVAEYRKSGDVDLLLLDHDKLEECSRILTACGCARREIQDALHHLTFQTESGIEIELHTLLAEPFDNRKVNQYLESLVRQCLPQVQWTEIMGVELPVLAAGYHGYELLVHMLQHFLRAGFGLKLLCDWVVFWNHEHPREECIKYLEMVYASGLKGFSDMVTLVCCEYLGLRRACVEWMEISRDYRIEEFMKEILEAEEFGRSAPERMVVLRGRGVLAYIREFHHQMRLGFPRVGRCFLLWPILWILTFVRFVGNNRGVRKVSIKAVVSKAAQRSEIMEQMKLWKY